MVSREPRDPNDAWEVLGLNLFCFRGLCSHMGTVGERAVSAPIRNATVMALLCFGKDDTGFGSTPLLCENMQAIQCTESSPKQMQVDHFYLNHFNKHPFFIYM